MKKFLGFGMVTVLLALSGASVWADGAAPAAGSAAVSQPAAAAAPAVKVKKAKKAKKAASKAAKSVWVCPMGDYSGAKTKDGKCPTCGMDLVEKK